jgi:plastocyanin
MTRPATTMRRLVGPLLLVAAVAIIAAACNGTGPSAYGAPASTATTTTASTTAATATNAATIKGFSFQPDVLKVKVGAKVTWTNDDTVAHTVTADTNSFASGNLQPGGSFSFTFTRPGTYAYHCSIHPSMHGSVVVG